MNFNKNIAEQNQKNIEIVNKWVSYLHQNQQNLHSLSANMRQKHAELDRKHADLSQKHQELHTSQSLFLQTHKKVGELESRHHETGADLRLTKQELAHLKNSVSQIFRTHDEKKDQERDLRRDFESLQITLKSSLRQYETEINNLKKENEALKEKINSPPVSLPTKSEVLASQNQEKRQQFEQKVLARIRPNFKSFVVKTIQELIGEGKYSTKELESIITQEKGLCGRTTFYSYLKELRDKGLISDGMIEGRTILIIQ